MDSAAGPLRVNVMEDVYERAPRDGFTACRGKNVRSDATEPESGSGVILNHLLVNSTKNAIALLVQHFHADSIAKLHKRG